MFPSVRGSDTNIGLGWLPCRPLRPITSTETRLCEHNGLGFIELPVAFDGIAVVVDKDNLFFESTHVEELKRLWEPAAEGSVVRWSDLRGSVPDTFDFFTKAIIGSEHGSRSDYRASEDDEELMNFVATHPGALGYFGLAYYAKNTTCAWWRSTTALESVNDANVFES